MNFSHAFSRDHWTVKSKHGKDFFIDPSLKPPRIAVMPSIRTEIKFVILSDMSCKRFAVEFGEFTAGFKCTWAVLF